MEQVRLGRTGLSVSRSGFGAIPIQRIGLEHAKRLLRTAYDRGINFFDTARSYTDSEEKIGFALSHVRKDIVIATKTPATDRNGALKDVETSLRNLRTDYIDIYQLHNPAALPDPSDAMSAYAALLEAKKQGKIRFIGITNHRLGLAREAIASGLYDTIQYPLSELASDADLEVIEDCRKHDLGVIAMKALAGGLLTNAAAAFAFLRQYENVVPIWGMQTESELDEFLRYEKQPPVLDKKMWQIIEQDRAALAGSFCRACGYCMPCPAGIPIPMAARMPLLLRRMPFQQFMKDEWHKQMMLIKDCQDCGHCKEQCPYHLDTPALLRAAFDDYEAFYKDHHPRD
ncbi:MAG TPA: aldo/keto reductase [Syntrophorhabdaceae bacterium]|nr:aldo/keto reductase [Syntrophorhabdaceae bacterium]